MNQVDIYIGDYRLDLFQDEEISITLNLQNISDISKLFADFTQTFTIPSSGINSEVLKQYYRTDVDASRITTSSTTNYPIWNGWFGAWETQSQSWGGGSSSTSVENTFDFRLRVPARIEINSLPFRDGTIQLEQVQLKGTEPYAYSISFFGSIVNLTDLFGEDYLYDLDFSGLDHNYDGATIIEGINGKGYIPLIAGGESGTNIIYPCISPVRDWDWNAHGHTNDENDIRYQMGGGHLHGINWYEPKPAVACTQIIAAIEAKYGITMSGFFDDNDEFQKLYMWAHRRAGYMYKDQPNAMAYQKIDFQTRTGTYFNLANDTFDIPLGFGSADGTFDFTIALNTLTPRNANFAIYVNGGYRTSQVVDATGTFVFFGLNLQDGDRISLRVKTQNDITPLTYGITTWGCVFSGATTIDMGTARMDATETISVTVRVSELMPEMKIADFIIGIIKMHNLVFVPVSNTEFVVQTLDDYYANSIDKDWGEYIDITETSVVRPPIYRRITFKYQEAGAILGETYRLQNGIGYGDLWADFDFDGEDFVVELPFEQLLFERLTDLETGLLTDNVLVGEAITRELQPYVGAPMLFYATGEFTVAEGEEDAIGFIDETDADTPLLTIWYCNASSRHDVNDSTTYSTNFGGDIDPYFLQSVTNSLYQTYWYNYTTDLYNNRRRLVNVTAQLPTGELIKLALNNKIIWNNQKWIINSANVNMTTGETKFQLLNQV